MTHTETNEHETGRSRESFWMRLFAMIVLLILFALAEAVLWVMALLQLVWLPINGRHSQGIADLGGRLGTWIKAAVEYLTGASDKRPFPWNSQNG